MLVSHMATKCASSLLKAHISPDRFGFFGSGSPWSPDIYRAVKKRKKARMIIGFKLQRSTQILFIEMAFLIDKRYNLGSYTAVTLAMTVIHYHINSETSKPFAAKPSGQLLYLLFTFSKQHFPSRSKLANCNLFD